LYCYVFCFYSGLPIQAQTSILGFTPSAAAQEIEVENKFKSNSLPRRRATPASHLYRRAACRRLQRNNELARYIADEWRQEGLRGRRHPPLRCLRQQSKVHLRLEMVAPVHLPRQLARDARARRSLHEEQEHKLSVERHVRLRRRDGAACLRHSGNPEDYELLRKQGIDVKGKVVLVRYSNPYSYRGFKALTAEREGAAAVLIYSDPAKMDSKRAKSFPTARGVPNTTFSAAPSLTTFMVPGDPLTPGWASVPGAKRISVEEATSIPKIMALPLSWHDAKRCFRTWMAQSPLITGRADCRSSITSAAIGCAST